MTPEERAVQFVRQWFDAEPDSAAAESLVQIIRDAVAEEREACAKLAESWVDPEHKEFRPQAVGCDAAFNEGLDCSAVNGIAVAIRERSAVAPPAES